VSQPSSRTLSLALSLTAALLCLVGAARDARADFAFVHVTDTHVSADESPSSRSGRDAALFREMSALNPRPAFAAFTGDVCEAGTVREYETFRRILDANLNMPIHLAPGNHDVRWNPLGKEGFVRGTGQPLYQSWDYENVHFVLLDATVTLEHFGHFERGMLEWLAADLKKIGTDRPVVIGMHHWIGRGEGDRQVDNESELLAVTQPYNVCLWIIGHGHSDVEWNVEGAPAIMAKGLYQGSYHLIEVSGEQMRIRRRSDDPGAQPKEILNDAGARPAPKKDEARWTDLLTIPLKRPVLPKWKSQATSQGDVVHVAATGELPGGAKLECRLNTGDGVAMKFSGGRWSGQLHSHELPSGEHVVTVTATLPDGRTFHRHAPLTITRPGTTSPAWRVDVGGGVQGHLACDGATVYVPTLANALVALDAKSGKTKWRFKTDGPVLSAPHVARDANDNSRGAVFFGCADHCVYAVNISDGTLRWKTKTDGAVLAGASSAKGVVCIGSADTKIYGLDARDGSVRWTARGGSLFQSKAATDGEVFIVGGWDNTFRALDATTGKERWKHKFGRSFYFAPAISCPVVERGLTFVSSNDGVLHAVRVDDGHIAWERENLKSGYSSPFATGDSVFTGALDGRLTCLQAETGEPQWSTHDVGTTYDSSPIVVGEAVYMVSLDGTACAVRSRDGARIWRYRIGGGGHVLSTPATDGRKLYFASMAGKITALPATGYKVDDEK
jgi:outer membrane protein assembly factor BamB